MEGIVALILSGMFIGHLPSLTASQWVKSGRLRPILPAKLSYDSTFECVFAAGTRLSRQLKTLEEVLSAEFRG